jgi:hypothetical protein
MKAKRERARDRPAPSPFIDPAGYRAFIARAEARFLEKLAAER